MSQPDSSSSQPIPLRSPLDSPMVLRFDTQQVRQILPQLIDALSDAVVVVDGAHRVVAANRRYLEAFGLRRDQVVGVRCRLALNCPEAEAPGEGAQCAACDVLELKEPRRLIRNLPDASGAQRRWEATMNPVLDETGEVTHVVEVWRDISERSRLESQLSHSERLASLGILAAGVAHEVNNPLASVMAGVESLQRWLGRSPGMDPEARAEAAEVLTLLEREARRCHETTDKLLLLAQPYRVAAGWVDFNRAVRDTLALLRYQMRKQRVDAVEELDGDVPTIWAREGGIRSVCMNLCMNAVQAMPSGGTLTLRTRRQGRSVVLEVQDSGPGISQEHLDRIWDPFFTTKPVGQGTGLGLSITQRIVVRHGGNIHVVSRPGEGARFVVELPVAGPGGDGV
ncbi:MAG: PAS domain-containing protein [Candidatus Eisenbacteria bacterium]|nr:PAS domain-containing protein [Candidatus Eisenbacteria bacterium]